MTCPAIITGEEFLARTLAHIDCQTQLIGSYGYLALGEPGSTASVLITGLLTLFVALFGLRLMFGSPPDAQDLVLGILKVGIVLTLAFSWPAFRTLIYDVVLTGPAEIANAILARSDDQGTANLAQRLQDIDTLIVQFTQAGTGRATGALLDEVGAGGSFEAAVLEDESTLGFARLSYLVGVISSLALLRLAAGLLLAITPIVAGLLLFGSSRGIFIGWLKGLILTILGSVGAATVLAVELAILEPWLVDAIRLRSLGYATPAAPIELFAMTLAFALVLVAMTWLLSRVAFQNSWPAIVRTGAQTPAGARTDRSPQRLLDTAQYPRSERSVSRNVERAIMRQEMYSSRNTTVRTSASVTASGQSTGQPDRRTVQPLGETYRRAAHRRSSLSNIREKRT